VTPTREPHGRGHRGRLAGQADRAELGSLFPGDDD
jgi:hypothetical protein